MNPLPRNLLFALLLALSCAAGFAAGSPTASPLIEAAKNGRPEAVEQIAKQGESLDTPDAKGRTALHYAAEAGHSDTAAKLLLYGASPNRFDAAGNAPLHLAVAKGHLALAQMLIVHGADVNKRDRAGQTPLHLAAQQDAPELVRLLLGFGANSVMRNTHGQTALDLALAKGRTETVKLLQPSSPDPGPQFVVRHNRSASQHVSGFHAVIGLDSLILVLFVIGMFFGLRRALRRRQSLGLDRPWRRRHGADATDPDRQAQIQQLWRGLEKMEQRLQNLETILTSDRPRV